MIDDMISKAFAPDSIFGRDNGCLVVDFHHQDRTHLGFEKGTPDGRIRSAASGRLLSQERLGGLHHRYNRAA
jgi:hypothetical protein